MIQIERYKRGKSLHACPACGRKSFTRFINENDEYLADHVGICGHGKSCGYRYLARDFFADNPQNRTKSLFGFKKPLSTQRPSPNKKEEVKPDYISKEIFLRTLCNYDQNHLITFLLNLFPENHGDVWSAVSAYFIGTTTDKRTIYWQIDRNKKVRTGKLIAYNALTGKRNKQISPNWIHYYLTKEKNAKRSPNEPEYKFNLSQCFFGEHLLSLDTNKPVAVVEAEKTAVIASICRPEIIWLAAGSKPMMGTERLMRLKDRSVIIYPDPDGIEKWSQVAAECRKAGMHVLVSSEINEKGTASEKDSGYDIADYLVNQQTQINEFNRFVDGYNAKLDLISADEALGETFEEMVEERLAIMDVADLPNEELSRIVERLA